MTLASFRPTAVSLLLTIVLGATLGSLSAILDAGPRAGEAPALSAELNLAGAAREDSGVPLRLTLTNDGPGDALMPLDGVLSLEVVDLGATDEPFPATYLAVVDATAPGSAAAVLREGESASTVVRLVRVAPLDRAGLYRVTGELVGPQGAVPAGTLLVDVRPAPVMATSRMR